MGYPIQAIHLPKTVDNDLPVTDNCPGFGSVAKYIAVSTREASYDVASMCESSTKVFIVEVMGRHAGWIAAAGGLAADADNDIPVVILFPEITFDPKAFLAQVKEKVEQYGYVSVVVSEGVQGADGKFLSDTGLVDAFGHSQLGGCAQEVASLIRAELGYKYHYAIADYLQRAARHLASKSDVDQAYAVGQAGVEAAVAGKSGIMMTIDRMSTTPYVWKIGETALSDVANVEKMMPNEYITEDGFGITQACRDYLQPLIEGEDYPSYKNGMPQYARIAGHLTQKKLDNSFDV